MAAKRRSKRAQSMSNTNHQQRKVAFTPSPEPRVTIDSVKLLLGKGTFSKGKGWPIHYWHIYHQNERVGHVSIYWIENMDAEPCASIDIAIRSASQGRGIGTIAYQKACEQSRFDQVFATLRKSNIASHIAAERAGFQTVEGTVDREARLVWTRTAVSTRETD